MHLGDWLGLYAAILGLAALYGITKEIAHYRDWRVRGDHRFLRLISGLGPRGSELFHQLAPAIFAEAAEASRGFEGFRVTQTLCRESMQSLRRSHQDFTKTHRATVTDRALRKGFDKILEAAMHDAIVRLAALEVSALPGTSQDMAEDSLAA